MDEPGWILVFCAELIFFFTRFVNVELPNNHLESCDFQLLLKKKDPDLLTLVFLFD